ncbi:MAG: nuclear transport factor 2 family protein [Nitratireductor sp.]|nr:nuclear transport factor 2 family protein [Nitratireductor sp.]
MNETVLTRKFARFAAALKVGDFESIAEWLDPEFVVHEAAGLPYGGTYRGAEGWRELSRAVVTQYSDFRFEPLELIESVDGNLVVRFAISGRSCRSGKEFSTTVLEFWRFRNGLLAEILPHYWDTHLLAELDDDQGRPAPPPPHDGSGAPREDG